MVNKGGTAGYSPSLWVCESISKETGFYILEASTLELRISRHLRCCTFRAVRLRTFLVRGANCPQVRLAADDFSAIPAAVLNFLV